MNIQLKQHPQIKKYMYFDPNTGLWSQKYPSTTVVHQTNYVPYNQNQHCINPSYVPTQQTTQPSSNKTFITLSKDISSGRTNQSSPATMSPQRTSLQFRNGSNNYANPPTTGNIFQTQQQLSMKKPSTFNQHISDASSNQSTSFYTNMNINNDRFMQQNTYISHNIAQQRKVEQPQSVHHNNWSNNYYQNVGTSFDASVQNLAKKQIDSYNNSPLVNNINHQQTIPQNFHQKPSPLKKNWQPCGYKYVTNVNSINPSSSKNLIANEYQNREQQLLKAQFQSLQTAYSQKQTKIKNLQTELTQCREKINQKDTQITNLLNVKKNHQSQKRKLQFEMRQCNNKLQISQQNTRKLESENTNLKTKTISYQSSYYILETENKDLQRKNCEILQKCKHHEAQINRLQSELNGSKYEIKNIKYDMENNSRLISQLNENISQKSIINQKLESELLTERNNTKVKIAELIKVKKQNQQLLEQKPRILDSIKFKQNALKMVQLDKQNMKLQIQLLRKQIQDKKVTESQNSSLRAQIDELNVKQAKDLNTLRQNASKEREQLAENIKRLQYQNEKLKTNAVNTRQQSLKQQMNKLSSRCNHLQSDLFNYNIQRNSLKSQIDRLNREIQSMQLQIVKTSQLIQQNESLKRKIESLRISNNKEEHIKNLQQQIQLIKIQKTKEIQQLSRQLEVNVSKKNQEINIAKREIIQRQKYIQLLITDINKMRQDIDKMCLDLGIMQSEKQSLKQLQIQLRQELQQKNNKLNMIEQEKKRIVYQKYSEKDQTLNQMKMQLISKQQTIKHLETTCTQNTCRIQELQRQYAIKLQQVSTNHSKYSQIQIENNNQLQRLKLQINQRDQSLNNLSKELQKKEDQIKNLKIINQRTYSTTINYGQVQKQYQKLKQQNNSKDKQINDLREQMKKYQIGIIEVRKDLKFVEQKKIKLEDQNSQLLDKYKELTNHLNILRTDITNNHNQQLKKLKKQKFDLEMIVKNLNEKSLKDKRDYEILISQKMDLQRANTSLFRDYNQLKDKNLELQTILSNQSQRNKSRQLNLQKEYQNLQQHNQKQLVLYEQLSKKHAEVINQFENRLAVKNSSQSYQIKKLNTQNLQLKNKLENLQRQHHEKLIILEELQAKLCQSQQKNRQIASFEGGNCRHLFHGDVLRQQDDYKFFIKQCIQNHIKKKIQDTRLIYRYDPLSKENIHRYIDQKPHLVVVIKVINGYYLAGYAEGVFKPRTPSDKDGLIMSLTNKKCYYLVEKNKRSIAYDDFFIIIGNSEIRIKSQQKKIFSNFGLSNSYFRHNGDGVSMLLGGGKNEREMQVVGYQFFQLMFKQQ